jgi:RND family efflux transporter MFP subunit
VGIAFSATWFFEEIFVSEILVVKAKDAYIRDSVTGNIRVHAAATYDLKAEVSGEVQWVAVLPLGNPLSVELNQTLILLDMNDVNRSITRLNLDRAQHRERIEAGSPTKILLQIREKELKDLQALAKTDYLSAYDIESKTNEVERLRTQIRHEQLADDHFNQNYFHRLSNLKDEIEKKSIKSPITGEFSSCYVAPGNQVFPGNLVGKVYSEQRIIEVSLLEEEFYQLKVGMPAGLSLLSTGNKIYSAKVSALSSTVDANSGIRKLYLEMDENNQSLPVGSSGRAEIIREEKESALIIPRKALVGDFVVVADAGQAKFKKVKVGAKNLKTVEILEGIKAGENVVIETPHLLTEGEKVKPILVSFTE